jgi:hypothetical protein
MLAKAFGRTLSDLSPVCRSSDRVSVPVLACALAQIEVEIPAHLMDLISQYNTERAADPLAWAVTPHERAGAKNAASEVDPPAQTRREGSWLPPHPHVHARARTRRQAPRGWVD